MAYSSDLVRTKDWGSEVLTDTDLEGQFDLIINWVMASLDAANGHKHTGAANQAPLIPLTTSVTGTLPLGNGGTGQTTLAGLLNLVYPVGSIYVNAAVSINPGVLLGFGTWEAFSAGKVIIGINTSDADYDSLSDTGGAKTVDASHTHTLTDSSTGISWGASEQGSGAAARLTELNGTTANSGGSSTLSIVQPYCTAYMWKRVS